jgi:hypothetical protein
MPHHPPLTCIRLVSWPSLRVRWVLREGDAQSPPAIFVPRTTDCRITPVTPPSGATTHESGRLSSPSSGAGVPRKADLEWSRSLTLTSPPTNVISNHPRLFPPASVELVRGGTPDHVRCGAAPHRAEDESPAVRDLDRVPMLPGDLRPSFLDAVWRVLTSRRIGRVSHVWVCSIRARGGHTVTVGRTRIVERNGVWGVFMLLAYIGAAIYFISRSGGGFWEVIIALLQAFVWPAYLIFHALQALGA